MPARIVSEARISAAVRVGSARSRGVGGPVTSLSTPTRWHRPALRCHGALSIDKGGDSRPDLRPSTALDATSCLCTRPTSDATTGIGEVPAI
jgi:hypothetical protein